MFSFYGSKSKKIKYYSKPKYDTIVEPFAGSARYSLEYWDKNIYLFDIDSVIVGVWKYLIQAQEKDILSLPDVPNATALESIDGFSQLCQEEKWLIGFCCNGGSAHPKNVSGRHNFNSWNKDKIRISKNLYKIRHWKIEKCGYESIENKNATWFIDPPYKTKGKWYYFHNIEYSYLAEWSLSRWGQVIVCENNGADWLPFRPLYELPFSHFKNDEDKTRYTIECVFEKDK